MATPGHELILKAAAFAADRHRSQLRKGTSRTPYINHPLTVARVLAEEGGVKDAAILAAALLHDTIEDTKTTKDELNSVFGDRVAELVAEVSDNKDLPKDERKRLQIEHAPHLSRDARQIKLADKICNLREILSDPPADWPEARKREYFEWAKAVVDQIRGANAKLAAQFDAVYQKGL